MHTVQIKEEGWCVVDHGANERQTNLRDCFFFQIQCFRNDDAPKHILLHVHKFGSMQTEN